MLEKFKSLRNLIGNTFRPATRTGNEFVMRSNDFGKIYLDTGAIRKIIERISFDGVHEVTNVVINTPGYDYPLTIKLNLVIEPDYSAPQIGAKLRDEIKASLDENFGIRDVLFDIKVMLINKVLPEKRRPRVR